MIVLDGSAALEWVLRRPAGDEVTTILSEPEQSVHVAHLFAVEVAQVLRRLSAATRRPAARRTARVWRPGDAEADHRGLHRGLRRRVA